MDELNRKLAEWAGFKLVMAVDKDTLWSMRLWVDPLTNQGGKHPNFTHSLGVCFKWLVPKLKCLVLEADLRGDGVYLAKVWAYVGDYELQATAWEKTPALAICRAIEKVIDAG